MMCLACPIGMSGRSHITNFNVFMVRKDRVVALLNNMVAVLLFLWGSAARRIYLMNCEQLLREQKLKFEFYQPIPRIFYNQSTNVL